MSTGWKNDKTWSDQFLPQIKRELGAFLLNEPPFDEDQERNTDLIVLKMDSVRIACRIRKYAFYLNQNYRNDFTIRSGRPSGAKTELAKIIEGWGDYLFYGFCNIEETELIAWRILSLNAFRLWFNRSIVQNAGKLPGFTKSNHDGSSSFMAFNAKQIPDCIKIEHGFNI